MTEFSLMCKIYQAQYNCFFFFFDIAQYNCLPSDFRHFYYYWRYKSLVPANADANEEKGHTIMGVPFFLSRMRVHVSKIKRMRVHVEFGQLSFHIFLSSCVTIKSVSEVRGSFLGWCWWLALEISLVSRCPFVQYSDVKRNDSVSYKPARTFLNKD